MVKMVTRTKGRSFEISKQNKLLSKTLKLLNPPEVTGIYDPSNSRARRYRSFKLGSKLKYLNSDQLLLFKLANWGAPNPPNLLSFLA